MRMISAISLFAAACCCGAETRDDILSFVNGDQLHGEFAGIGADSSIIWKRDDVGGEVRFKGSELRRVVLNGGEPVAPLGGFSHIGLTDGDRIPGRILELNDKRILIDTEFAESLEIPREKVALLAPNPMGGKVLYHGPFVAADWEMIDEKHPDGIPAAPAKGEKQDGIARWKHAGSAWYWDNAENGTGLVRRSGMPDRAILRFDMAWKSRLSLAVGFHSNFMRPEKGDGRLGGAIPGGGTASLPGLFGESYVLHLYSNYVMLYRTSFDEEGNARLDRVQTSNSSLRLGDTGKATVEIRCNRVSGEISLFVNGEFVAQWSELGGIPGVEGYAGKGEGFGFVAQSEGSPVRISEIFLAEWNGMPDAARSMQVDDADIVLLANGTDRFSGKVAGIENGVLKLEGRFGDFEFPLGEVAEIRFAKSGLAEEEESSAEVRVRFHPLGRISGKALGGDGKTLRLGNAYAGETEVRLDSAVMLEFRDTNGFLDGWDDEF